VSGGAKLRVATRLLTGVHLIDATSILVATASRLLSANGMEHPQIPLRLRYLHILATQGAATMIKGFPPPTTCGEPIHPVREPI